VKATFRAESLIVLELLEWMLQDNTSRKTSAIRGGYSRFKVFHRFSTSGRQNGKGNKANSSRAESKESVVRD
jgi:hypothetical protein